MEWLVPTLERVLLGTVGGLAAFWLANRRFISQRSWDQRLKVYSQTIDVLNRIEHSLSVIRANIEVGSEQLDNGALRLNIEGASEALHSKETRDAAQEFSDANTELIHLQSMHMIFLSPSAHQSVIVLYAALSAINPWFFVHLEPESEEGLVEVLDLVKQSGHYVGGCSGTLAFEARRQLGLDARWPQLLRSAKRKFSRRKPA
jgi:hypothetical protein